jgi:hypothetical protein
VIALTRDFHIFASRASTGCSAVLLSIRHNAQAWYVCAHSLFWVHQHCRVLVRHCFRPFAFSDYETPQLLTRRPDGLLVHAALQTFVPA